MQLKQAPRVNARYWTAILLASMCGANLGDVFTDILHVSVLTALAILAGVFAVIVIADGASKRGSEASYWAAILLVRAAATQIGDFAVGKDHVGYPLVAAVFALVMAALLGLRFRTAPLRDAGELPQADGIYWLTMLAAGSLGTVIGDGLGHAFGSMEIGVPVSAGISTVAVGLMLGLRGGLAWRSSLSYWLAIVAVRWWGTSTGDILAFVTSLLLSLAVTGGALLILLIVWREGTSRPLELAPSSGA
jgi:uncharacterized membrane-anchored protein